MPAKSTFSFKQNLHAQSVLSFTTSSKCFLPPKVGVEGELISNNSLCLKIFEQTTAFFADTALVSLSQDEVFKWLEGIGDLNSHQFVGN